MVRLALLGTLSSHTETFCKCAAERSDVQIVGIFGEDPERTEYLSQKYTLDIKTPEELLSCCDVAAIMFRDGSKHLKYAEPFIRKGTPVFIDKPFTISVADAQVLVDLLKQTGCPFTAGSVVKLSEEILALKERIAQEAQVLTGYCSFTIDFDSIYGGMHFYSHHLIEEMLTLFGTGVRSITAKRTGKNLAAIAAYDTFQVIMNYGIRWDQHYAGFCGANGHEMVSFGWSKAGKAQFDEMIQLALTGESKYTPEYFLEAVKISCALEESMITERTVPLT